MKLWEAMKLLEEGKKVRRVYWDEDEYITTDEYGNIVYCDGRPYVNAYLSDNWELFQ